jgi:hypothetical protein
LLGSGGECRRSCDRDADCDSEGIECARAVGGPSLLLPNSCQPLPKITQLSANQTGALCHADADCGQGFCVQASDPRGGYCSGTCTEDSHCGHGGACVHGLYGSGGTCEESCDQDEDCQRDSSGWGCGPDGLCIRKADPLSTVGAPCSAGKESEDCGPSGTCRLLGLAGEHYPGGYCVGSCSEDSDCGEHGVCINGITCMRACASAADCRPDYACRPHPQAMGEDRDVTICYPAQS